MIGEEKGGDFAVWGDDVADFDLEYFENGVGGRGDFHFADLGFYFGQLSFGLGDAFGASAGQEQIVTAFGGSGVFLEESDAGHGAIAFGLGNGFFLEQLLDALLFGAGEFEFGDECLPVVFSGFEFLLSGAGFQLCENGNGLGMACLEFGGIEADDELFVREGIAFAGEGFLDAAAVAGSQARFIHFDGAGDEIGPDRFVPF